MPLSSSPLLRLAGIAVLVALLQLPVLMVGALVTERQTRRDTAVNDVSSRWGHAQTIVGPALIVPYTYRWTEIAPTGLQLPRSEERLATFLPARLRVRGAVQSEMRSRGIFAIPVYTLKVVVDGEFADLRPADLGIDPGAVAWARARLAVRISDVRAIQEQTTASWNGANVPFVPGSGWQDGGNGIHADVAADAAAPRYAFSFPLALNGSVAVFLTPFAETTTVELRSNSPHPNFQGAWLPVERTVTADGFSARWNVPSLGRSYPQAWTTQAGIKEAIDRSTFGVELIEPVDHYRMAARSVKYAALFLMLTFAVVWLLEVLSEGRVHPIQYLLLGAALCVFYLLELSLSEHLGFDAAYAIAASAVVALVGAYSVSMLRKVWRAAIVAAGVGVLYGYLYVLLTNEDYALLIGSIGLFAALAVVMLVTRRIDWYAGPLTSDSR
jgi:inner membrane protein